MTRAEQRAKELLAEFGVKQIPIPVERLARGLNLELAFEPFDSDVSGMLFRDDSHAVVGVNSAHAKVRQRFSIAHEIGHYLLHKGTLIVDRSVRVNNRDERATLGTDQEEIEANQFAAALLMPERQVLLKLTSISEAVSDPAVLVRRMASRFDVSTQAMEYRLANLGLLDPS